MVNIIENVSTLTTIPIKTLAKLIDKIVYCVNDAAVEGVLNEEDVIDLDIGIGILKIKISDEEIKYKFIPSSELEKSVINAVKHKTNELQLKLESTLSEKFINTYKDLF